MTHTQRRHRTYPVKTNFGMRINDAKLTQRVTVQGLRSPTGPKIAIPHLLDVRSVVLGNVALGKALGPM